MQGSASIRIEAPPEKVYELISDVTRTGEWSPECISAEWIDGATGPAVGARFKGRNQMGWMKWSTTPEVLVADPGREFAFKTKETIWRYKLDGVDGATEVTESFETTHYPFYMKILSPPKRREPAMVEGVKTTLARIKSAAEGSAA